MSVRLVLTVSVLPDLVDTCQAAILSTAICNEISVKDVQSRQAVSFMKVQVQAHLPYRADCKINEKNVQSRQAPSQAPHP